MKVKIESSALHLAFELVMPVLQGGATDDITGNYVKLHAFKKSANLVATSRTATIKTQIVGVQVDKPGVALVPIQFREMLRTPVPKTWTLESNAANLRAVAGDVVYDLPVVSTDAFPSSPTFSREQYREVRCKGLTRWSLNRLIEATRFASHPSKESKAGVPYDLHGVWFELSDEAQIAVALDGFRMAIAGDIPASETVVPGYSFFVPMSSLDVISAVLNWDRPLHIMVQNPQSLVLAYGITLVHVKLGQGRFPVWRTLRGKKADKPFQVTVDSHDLALAKWGARIAFSSDRMQIARDCDDDGKVQAEIPVVNKTLNPLPTEMYYWNLAFLNEWLRAVRPVGPILVEFGSPSELVLATTASGDSQLCMCPISHRRAEIPKILLRKSIYDR